MEAVDRSNLSNGNLPIVSIVTIVLNGERYLENAIKSVLEQSYPNVQYIIVDGGSTDSTLAIIKTYETSISFWISEKDKGLSDALNKSIKYCKGDFVLFLPADDILENHAIVELMNALWNSKSRWSMGFYKYINSKDEIIKKDFLRDFSFFDMELRNIVRHQAALVPKSVFQEIQFETTYKYAMDYMFFLKAWRLIGPPAVVKEHIVRFRLDGKNLSSNYYASINDEMRVRRDFRKQYGQSYKLPFDYFVYLVRLAKIYFYHSGRYNVG